MHRWSSRYAGTGSSDEPGCAIPALAQPRISTLQVSVLGRNVVPIAVDTGGEIALGTRAFGSLEPKMRVTSKRERLSGNGYPCPGHGVDLWIERERQKERDRVGGGRERARENWVKGREEVVEAMRPGNL